MVVHASKLKALRGAAAVFAFIALQVDVLRRPQAANDLALRILFVGSFFTIFGPFLVNFLLLLFSSAPLLVHDQQGIERRGWLAGTGVIAWSEIEGLTIVTTSLTAHLVDTVGNPQPIVARQTRLQRLFHRYLTGAIG
jgi:hypothetical protein